MGPEAALLPETVRPLKVTSVAVVVSYIRPPLAAVLPSARLLQTFRMLALETSRAPPLPAAALSFSVQLCRTVSDAPV